MRIRWPWPRRWSTRRQATDRRRRVRNARRRGPDTASGTPWLALAALLPGLAGLVALVFTWMSVAQTQTELRIAEQGQITNRFNDAVSHLGSESPDVQFGGIYALERIMQDSPRDQPRIISVLSAFVRTHAPFLKEQRQDERPTLSAQVTAAAAVLAARPNGQDGHAKINWAHTDLQGFTLRRDQLAGDPSAPRRLPFAFADLTQTDLRKVVFTGVDLHRSSCEAANLTDAHLLDVDMSGAYLSRAQLAGARLEQGTSLRFATLSAANLSRSVLAEDTDLSRADLRDANLADANLTGVNFRHANLASSTLSRVNLKDADLTKANLAGANLTEADLWGADLTGATLLDANLDLLKGWDINLTRANLSEANLTGANLFDADLTGANLSGADLSKATLLNADLTGANLTGAKLDGAIGLPDDLVDNSD